MKIALAQMDPKLGDVDANLRRTHSLTSDAVAQGADLVVFPELALNGYALGLLDGDRSLDADDPRLTDLTVSGADVLIGFHEDGRIRRYNSAMYADATGVRHVHRKLYLPTYLAWEEKKHSSNGQSLNAFDTRFGRMATLICNDAWQPVLPWLAVQDGAEVLLIPTNSAVGHGVASLDVIGYWGELLRFTARTHQCWVVFANRVGDEGGSRFWGGSRILDPDGEVVAEAPLWDPSLTLAEIDIPLARRRRHRVPLVAEARLGMVQRQIARLIEQGGDL